MVDKKTCAGRGRPRGFDVEAAVETALELFRARGYDGVGVAELAKAIGVGAPSLYAAFGCKAGLFERALERYVAREGGFIAAALTESLSLPRAIENVLLRAAEVYTATPDLPGCLVMDGTRNSTDAGACALTQALRAATRRHLRAFIANERPDDADDLADGLMVALAGLSAAARDGVPPERLRKSAAILAEGIVIV